MALKEKNIVFFLFSLPFGFIGIRYLCKLLCKKFKHVEKEKKQSKWNGLIGFTLCCGLALLFLGIKDTYQVHYKTKNYVTTTAYFKDYQIYKQDSDGSITYQLIYVYQVEGKEYTISTDYGANYIPNEDSTRDVKYNPYNHEQAILVGTNRSNSMIYIGAFFTLGSFTFVLVILSACGLFDKVKLDVMRIYIGVMFLLIGVGIIVFQNGTTNFLLETIHSFGLWILIPIMFVLIGIFQIMKSFVWRRKIKS